MSIRNQQSVISTSRVFDRNRQVLVLVGPTASGKTAISIELAKLLDGEIISADSRQIYRDLDVGTAKPTKEQRAEVMHYFVDELLPDQEFNAGKFGEMGRGVIDEIFARQKTPIVVGGSGLYVRSLIDGFFEGPGADRKLRETFDRQVEAGELKHLVEELRRVDPVSASRIDPTKPRRIIRALEVFHTTGKPLSEHQQESSIVINFVPRIFGLEWERKALYERIDSRCDEMIRNGLLQEVEGLARSGYTTSLNALNTVGYAEAFAYQSGKIPYEEMVRLFKQNSRRYAKRQLTWFRKDERVTWITMSGQTRSDETALRIAQLFRSSIANQ